MPALDDSQLAQGYAQKLLADLGERIVARPVDEHPALAWARCGMMALTGRADGDPLMCPAPLAACADGALAALSALVPGVAFAGLRGSDCLSVRAAIAGLSRAGAIASGGACRLLPAADAWVAVNLAREEDWSLLAAWFEEDVEKNWTAVETVLKQRRSADVLERGRCLGLAVAPASAAELRVSSWFHRQVVPANARIQSPKRTPAAKELDSRLRGNDEWPAARPWRVVDLSALWAGPLCAQLLQRAGAEVIKVESPRRPDGARFGPPAFYEQLNAGKRLVSIDPTLAEGRVQLSELLASADIVIESSRPRALRQFGIRAEDFLARNSGLVWMGLSGYGRGEPQENWIAYGDDAGVAAGLSQLMLDASGERVFVGDAIADPMTGLHAALAAFSFWRRGQGGLISLALSEVVRHCAQFERPDSPEGLRRRQGEWTRLATA